MLVQVTLEREGLVAAFAFEVLEGRVGLHVGAQVRAVGEGLAAVGAPERLLARVGPHVALQQPRPTERFPAHIALVLEVVCEQVHGHGGHGHVHLPAGGALLCQLAVQRAVCLFVPAQVGRRGVGLAALVAGVPLDAPGAAEGFPSRAAVGDEEGVHCVPFAHCRVAIYVAICDFRAGAVGRLGVRSPVVAVDPVVEGIGRGHLDATIALAIIHNRADVVTDVRS